MRPVIGTTTRFDFCYDRPLNWKNPAWHTAITWFRFNQRAIWTKGARGRGVWIFEEKSRRDWKSVVIVRICFFRHLRFMEHFVLLRGIIIIIIIILLQIKFFLISMKSTEFHRLSRDIKLYIIQYRRSKSVMLERTWKFKLIFKISFRMSFCTLLELREYVVDVSTSRHVNEKSSFVKEEGRENRREREWKTLWTTFSLVSSN